MKKADRENELKVGLLLGSSLTLVLPAKPADPDE
jgi:hypothetical protein